MSRAPCRFQPRAPVPRARAAAPCRRDQAAVGFGIAVGLLAAQQILTSSKISSTGLAPHFFQGMNSQHMYPNSRYAPKAFRSEAVIGRLGCTPGAWPSSGCVPRACRVRCEAARPTPRSLLHPRSGTRGLQVARDAGSKEQVPSPPECCTGPPLTRSPRRTGPVPPGGSLLATEELPTCREIPVAPPESDPSGS